MKVVKSLHAGVLHRTTEVFEQKLFTLSSLWGFQLSSGRPVLEQDLWTAIADAIADGEVFDPGTPKVRAEYLVSGHFQSPGGKPTSGGIVTVSLGEREKKLAVFGDRYWTAGSFSDPEPISEMPLTYEHAFGGKGFEPNPVGKGMEDVDAGGEKRRPLPNVEYASRLMTSSGSRPDPASLGRLDPTWPQRTRYGGTYDQTYVERYMPGFPPDLDPLFFNEAPDDQWFEDALTGTEAFRIEQMNADHPVLSGALPGIRGRLFVQFEGEQTSEVIELDSWLDTVWFLPNQDLGILIHRGSLPLGETPESAIKSVMLAHEYQSDPPRDKSHYDDQLEKRTNPEHGIKYMLNTRDLLPSGVTCGFDELNERSDMPLEGMASDNMQQFVQNKMDATQSDLDAQMEEARKSAEDNGLDAAMVADAINARPEPTAEQKAIEALLEKAIPGYQDRDQPIDYTAIDLTALDDLTEYMNTLKQEKQEEVESAIREQVETLRGLDGASPVADELEAMLAQSKQAPPLPRITRELDAQRDTIRAQWEETQRQLMLLQSMGTDISTVQSQLPELEQMEAYLDQAREQAEQGYRDSAHTIERASSPHPGEEANLAREFARRLTTGASLQGWDGAFVDLTRARLSGTSLKGALLEYAGLSEAHFVDVDLSGAILAHADLSQARFTRCTFKDANLGRSRLEGCEFEDCDLSGTILAYADLDHTRFLNCQFSDRQDTFIGARLAGCRFSGCGLARSTFYQLEMRGCRFDGSSLDESNFLECDLSRGGFEAASLNGVNFVSTNLADADFSRSISHNIRFVNACNLEGSRFQACDARQSNFRETAMKAADLTEANIDECDFSGADLRQALLTRATAYRSLFVGTNLERLDGRKLNAMEASFQDARLPAADFRGANLFSANFYGVTVGDTDFRDANLKRTLFKDWRPGRG